MLRRSVNTLFRSYSTKVSSEEAIARTKESIKVLNKGLDEWAFMDSLCWQKDGVGASDKPSNFLSENEQCQINGVAKSLGIPLEYKGLATIKKDFLEKLTELNTFEVERAPSKKMK